MTPKRKAKIMVDLFCGRFKGNGRTKFDNFLDAKFFATECVNEILSINMIYCIVRDFKDSEGIYWEQVKNEINKL